MLLSFLICCSFTVIRYIVKRIQVLIKLSHRNIFWFTFPIASLFFQTGFYAKQLFIFQLWYHQPYYINCVTTVRLHFHILKQHYMNSFTCPSPFPRFLQILAPVLHPACVSTDRKAGEGNQLWKEPLEHQGRGKVIFQPYQFPPPVQPH